MEIKVLINVTIALIFIGLSYSLFYFEVIPRLINHYRKVTRRSKVYEQQIKDIEEMK